MYVADSRGLGIHTGTNGRRLGAVPEGDGLIEDVIGGVKSFFQSSDPQKDRERMARIDLALDRALADPTRRYSDFGTNLPCTPCTGPEYIQYMTHSGASQVAREYAQQVLAAYQAQVSQPGGIPAPGGIVPRTTTGKLLGAAAIGGLVLLLLPKGRGS